jgi:hypothetical protein
MPRIAPVLLAFMAALPLRATAQHAHAQHAHQHGQLRLSIAVDGEQLNIALEAPLDSLVGFERTPRTDAERRSAAAAVARLRDAGGLFTPDTAAQCTAQPVELDAGLLAPGAVAKPGQEHADLEATYSFRCAHPAQLRTLQTTLLDSFPRASRIDVQVAGPRGQRKAKLQRPARTIELAR